MLPIICLIAGVWFGVWIQRCVSQWLLYEAQDEIRQLKAELLETSEALEEAITMIVGQAIKDLPTDAQRESVH